MIWDASCREERDVRREDVRVVRVEIEGRRLGSAGGSRRALEEGEEGVDREGGG